MDVHVENAWNHVMVFRIDDLRTRTRFEVRADRGDLLSCDSDIGDARALRSNDIPSANDGVESQD
jgi:hypothetical protein